VGSLGEALGRCPKFGWLLGVGLRVPSGDSECLRRASLGGVGGFAGANQLGEPWDSGVLSRGSAQGGKNVFGVDGHFAKCGIAGT
jgi:hypothetical protein